MFELIGVLFVSFLGAGLFLIGIFGFVYETIQEFYIKHPATRYLPSIIAIIIGVALWVSVLHHFGKI